MIKVRLHGEAPEVERVATLLRELAVDGEIRILNESANYDDRPPSVYVRRFVDVERLEGPNHGRA